MIIGPIGLVKSVQIGKRRPMIWAIGGWIITSGIPTIQALTTMPSYPMMTTQTRWGLPTCGQSVLMVGNDFVKTGTI